MDYIIDGFDKALALLVSFDRELYGIIGLSVFVSTCATLFSALFSMPMGIFLGLRDFPGKRLFSRVLYTLMSIPSVLVGLLIAILLSRRGPLGYLELMFTPTAMIIAQFVLVTPLMMGLVYTVTKDRGKEIERTGRLLGARRHHIIFLVARELKLDLFMAGLTAFSRAISEVGAVMIVGGNIKGHTRVITTSIVMFNSMGEYGMSIALGLILLTISLVMNSILYTYREGA